MKIKISQIIEIIYKIQKRIKILSFVYANIRWIHHSLLEQVLDLTIGFMILLLKIKKFFYEKKDEKKFIEWKKK